MSIAPQYLPLTDEQKQKLSHLIDKGYKITRIIANGVETLRVEKPFRKRR